MKRTHLSGEIEGPSGQAPEAAWQAVDSEVRRSQDLWLSGDPQSLTGAGFEGWGERIRERLQAPIGHSGLRMRFVFPEPAVNDDLDLLALVTAVLGAAPQEALFLHGEVMSGPEPGLHLAWENRPPALMTHLHLAEQAEPEGQLAEVSGPLHVNFLLHDVSMDFHHALRKGIVEKALRAASAKAPVPFELRQVHQLSMARSDAHESGVSIGVEQVHEERGSRGGFSAADVGSRAPSQLEARPDLAE